MKFEKLDITRHDLDKVSELIYETELAVFRSLLGKDKNNALENIKKLVKFGNNSLGQEHIHVVSDGAREVRGILVSFCGKETNLRGDFKAYFKILNFYGFLKYVVKGTVINELLTANIGRNDYYLSNIAVSPEFRGQGIGSCILENVFKLAEGAGCRRVILDVTLKNDRARRLYEKFEFRVYGKKEGGWFLKGEGTYNMERIEENYSMEF
jgi:ribosomal protein S18 acetylase RimI-like enzyme